MGGGGPRGSRRGGPRPCPTMGREVELESSALGRRVRAGGLRSAGVQRSLGGARPPKGTDKEAASPDPRAASSRGLSTKRGAGGTEDTPRAGAHGTVDPHDWERRFLRLIPTSMKTAPAARQQALCPGPSRGSCSRDPSPFCVSSSAPLSALPTSAARRAASLPGLSPRALGLHKEGQRP